MTTQLITLFISLFLFVSFLTRALRNEQHRVINGVSAGAALTIFVLALAKIIAKHI